MAVNLFRKPGDPYDPILGPLQSGVYSRGYARKAAAAAPTPAPTSTVAAPASAGDYGIPGYKSPTAGSVRGTSKFAAGFGADAGNNFDINEYGAGLYAAGYDINRINYGTKAKSDFVAQLKDYQTKNSVDLSGYFAKNPGQQSRGDIGYIEGMDWYFRNQARAQDKSNSFLDSTIGKIVTVGAQIAASFIPGVGPAVSAAIGATTGGLTNGPLGALTGALSGYGIGKATQFVAGGGLQRAFGSLLGKGATSSVPSAGAAATSASGVPIIEGAANVPASTSLLGKAAGVAKGAFSSIDKVATVANAGLGIRDLITGGAAAGAGYIAAQTLGASSGTPAPITPAPAQAVATSADELQREKEARRRRITQTNQTWGNTLLAPNVKKPTLLGGASKLAA